MATKKTYREAQDLSKLNPNQVMDMILYDPKKKLMTTHFVRLPLWPEQQLKIFL